MDGQSTHDRRRALLMAALDGELDAPDRAEFEQSLQADPVFRSEWDRLSRVKEVTTQMTFKQPPDSVWQDYWSSVYRRLERRVGWILFSLGAIVLLSYGGVKALEGLWDDPTIPWFLKGAIFSVMAGLVVLSVSVVREKLFTNRKDPYKDVTQ